MHLPGCDAKPYQFTENREIAYWGNHKSLNYILEAG